MRKTTQIRYAEIVTELGAIRVTAHAAPRR